MNVDDNRININVLKQNYQQLQLNYQRFKSGTYDIFLNGYINKCNNEITKTLSVKLGKSYGEIDKLYIELLDFLKLYIENVEGIESKLSGNNGMISDNLIRGYVESKLNIDKK